MDGLASGGTRRGQDPTQPSGLGADTEPQWSACSGAAQGCTSSLSGSASRPTVCWSCTCVPSHADLSPQLPPACQLREGTLLGTDGFVPH